MTKETGTALALRVCGPDMESYGGFIWPGAGEECVAPDWSPEAECGNGLHFWLYGQGDSSFSKYIHHPDAKWLVIEVSLADCVLLGGKAKAPRARVLFAGDRKSATDYLIAHEPRATRAVIGAEMSAGDRGTATVGDRGTATVGDYGTATAGDYGGTATAGYHGIATVGGYFGTAVAGYHGTATAGHRGIATAGHRGIATAGHRGTATAGDYGAATAGDYGTATAGRGGTATAGDYGGTATAGDYGTTTAGDYGAATAGEYGTATAGYRGTATVGDYGTATAGEHGTAIAGEHGTAAAGPHGEIRIRYLDNPNVIRYRTRTGYIGEDGLEPYVKYRLNSDNEFERAE